MKLPLWQLCRCLIPEKKVPEVIMFPSYPITTVAKRDITRKNAHKSNRSHQVLVLSVKGTTGYWIALRGEGPRGQIPYFKFSYNKQMGSRHTSLAPTIQTVFSV